MDSGAGDTHRQRLLLDVVVQNLRAIGATSTDEFLGVQSLLPAGAPSRQNRQERTNLKSNADHAPVAVPSSAVTTSGGLDAAAASERADQAAADDGHVGPASDSDLDSKRIPLPSSAESAVASASASTPLVAEMDECTRQIEECCMEWRAGRVRPYWLVINEPKFARTQGCALRIQLSRHAAKVYSVATDYPSGVEARAACAQVAIAQGVLDYIRYGDGQTRPAVKLGPDDGESFSGEPVPPGLEDVRPWSVQAFLDALPQPLPESFAQGKSATEINAPAWLNTTIQSARGSRLLSSFIWTADNSGLHGALLRLTRPGETHSWLVAARFTKRAEAKAAVCLLALSEGVGAHIRNIIAEVDARLTPAMRRTVNDVLLPTLLAECRRVRPSAAPVFEYDSEADACGCTMTIDLSSPEQSNTRTYTVPPDYRNRVDAKLAVIVRAVEQGAVEFVRFRGGPPPPGYVALDVHRLTGFGGPQHQQQQSQLQGPPPPPNQQRKRKNDMEWSGRDVGGFGLGQEQRKRFRPDGGGFHAHPGPGRYQPLYGGGATFPPAGMWGVAPTPTAYAYPIPVQMPAAPTPYANAYSPLAPQLTANDPYQPANPGAATPYASATGVSYGVQPTASVPYGAPYAPAPTAAYNPYQNVNMGYATPGAYYAAPSAPPAQTRPQMHAQPQPYSPHTTGAPVVYPQLPPQNMNMHVQLPPQYSPAPSHLSYPTPTPPVGMQTYAPSPTSGSASLYASVAMQNCNSAPPTPSPGPGYMQDDTQAQHDRDRKALPKRERVRGPAGSKKILVQSAPKSSVTELYDHCATAGLPAPQFCNEIVTDEKADSKHKVWIVIGKQKYELPVKFNSLSQGQERVAKKVLEQLRS